MAQQRGQTNEHAAATDLAEVPTDVCLIDGDRTQRVLLLQRLLSLKYNVTQCADGLEGLCQVRRQHPRVVICDLHAAHLDGLQLCRHIRTDPTLASIYLIVASDRASRQHMHAALHAGADDYVLKPYDPEELTARIRNGLRINALQERLRKAALTDGLTGLWNHTQLCELLEREFARTRRYGTVTSLLMLDLDHFKAVNDTYGHEAGNRVLQATAQHLRSAVRDTDAVARYGGEEFVVLCPQTALDEALQLAERIRASFPQRTRVPDLPQLAVTACIGAASTADPRVGSASDLLDVADQALYAAKRAGRDRVVSAAAPPHDPFAGGVQVADVDRLQKQVVALSMQSKDLCLQSIWALVQALEARDPHTARHSRNVTFIANALAERTGWPENLRLAINNAAMLHALGKIGIPDRILLKPGPLTPDEAALMRRVPLMTCKILEPLRIFETETTIIRHMREHYDGSGYPDGLAANRIPLGSRLLAVAEAFAAMTATRSFRRHRSAEDAVAEIRAEAGRQFAPEFTELLEHTHQAQRERWQAQIDSSLAQVRMLANGELEE